MPILHSLPISSDARVRTTLLCCCTRHPHRDVPPLAGGVIALLFAMRLVAAAFDCAFRRSRTSRPAAATRCSRGCFCSPWWCWACWSGWCSSTTPTPSGWPPRPATAACSCPRRNSSGSSPPRPAARTPTWCAPSPSSGSAAPSCAAGCASGRGRSPMGRRGYGSRRGRPPPGRPPHRSRPGPL